MSLIAGTNQSYFGAWLRVLMSLFILVSFTYDFGASWGIAGVVIGLSVQYLTGCRPWRQRLRSQTGRKESVDDINPWFRFAARVVAVPGGSQVSSKVERVHQPTAKRRFGVVLVVGVATLSLQGIVPNAMAAERSSPSTEQFERPSPVHLIVGPAIKLPTELYTANAPAVQSLISPNQARTVETTMWRLWETELVQSDTRALSQLIAAGPLLAGTIDQCAFPSGRCVPETSPRSFTTLEVVVPRQRSYPIDFLAQVRTTQYVDLSNGTDRWEPWVELQVLTKDSATSPWKLSFDTGYDGINSTPPPLMTFDSVSLRFANSASQLYSAPSHLVPPVPANKELSLLAAYYQSYKDTGHPPTSSPFEANGYASGIGQDLATDPQGEIFAGNRQSYTFTADPGAGSWQFSSGGYPVVCGSVLDTYSVTPVSGLIYQNSDESNYGVPLSPGEYHVVTTLALHQTCVYLDNQGNIDNVGDSPEDYEVIGKGGPGASGAPQTDTVVHDLETTYGVLGYQLEEYASESDNCKASDNYSCSKTLARQITGLFTNFSNTLTDHVYPVSARSDVRALNATVESLGNRFAQIAAHPTTVGGQATAIETGAIDLNEQFNALIGELEPLVI